MKNKTMYILRGVPGCGKTTLAKNLGGVICEADQYFMQEEKYLWSFENLEKAHQFCWDKCEKALADGEPVVVVANTNIREKDVIAYYELGRKYEYNVFVLTVENWHGGIDIHGVPYEKRKKMAKDLINTIKLI
jgi:predicted kinase